MSGRTIRDNLNDTSDITYMRRPTISDVQAALVSSPYASDRDHDWLHGSPATADVESKCRLPDVSRYHCPACSKAFIRRKQAWLLHVGRLCPEMFTTRYACSECPKQFTRKDNFQRHAKTCHAICENNTYVCTHQGCGRHFARRDTLRRHETTVHNQGARVHTCSTCHKSFNRISSLKRHSHICDKFGQPY